MRNRKKAFWIFLFFVLGSSLFPQQQNIKVRYKYVDQWFMLYKGEQLIKKILAREESMSLVLVLDKYIYLIANEDFILSHGEYLYPLYKINMQTGQYDVIDHMSQNLILSLDGKYCLFDGSIGDSDEEALVLKRLRPLETVGVFPISEIDHQKPSLYNGFIVWSGKRTDGGCIVKAYSDVYPDVSIIVDFDKQHFQIQRR